VNWDAVGAIGEVAGAVAVVATLFYLAAQIRQNSNEIVDSRTQGILELMIKTRSELAEGRIAEIQAKIDAEKELTPEEEIRFRAHRAENMNIWEAYHFNSRAGKINSDLDEVMESRLMFSLTGDNPASLKNRTLWERTRMLYSNEFRNYVDALIESANRSDA